MKRGVAARKEASSVFFIFGRFVNSPYCIAATDLAFSNSAGASPRPTEVISSLIASPLHLSDRYGKKAEEVTTMLLYPIVGGGLSDAPRLGREDAAVVLVNPVQP